MRLTGCGSPRGPGRAPCRHPARRHAGNSGRLSRGGDRNISPRPSPRPAVPVTLSQPLGPWDAEDQQPAPARLPTRHQHPGLQPRPKTAAPPPHRKRQEGGDGAPAGRGRFVTDPRAAAPRLPSARRGDSGAGKRGSRPWRPGTAEGSRRPDSAWLLGLTARLPHAPGAGEGPASAHLRAHRAATAANARVCWAVRPSAECAGAALGSAPDRVRMETGSSPPQGRRSAGSL